MQEVEIIKSQVLSREPPSIKSKRECYILYECGFLGNKVETANSYEEVLEKGWIGTVSIRSRGKSTERSLVYNFPIEKIPEELKIREEMGFDIKKISFSKTPPDNKLKFQGELMLTKDGFHILYSTVKKPMNLALKEEEKILSGLSALNFLKENFNPASLEDIHEIFLIFPNDVIEFSCYEVNLGTLNNRNVIIWEVRGY